MEEVEFSRNESREKPESSATFETRQGLDEALREEEISCAFELEAAYEAEGIQETVAVLETYAHRAKVAWYEIHEKFKKAA